LIDDPDTHMLRNAGQRLMSLSPDSLHTGFNSGYQAMNIAVLAGAARIVLVGYDAKPGPDGRKHFFGDHPDKTSAPYAHMLIAFKEVAPWLKDRGIEVLNASPDSALTMFERVQLQDVFT
jgi:hypothetical protein